MRLPALNLGRLSRFIGDRREARRLRAVRRANLLAGAVASWPAQGSFTGTTLDISADGLAVLVEGVECGRLQALVGSSLTLVVALPTGSVSFQAEAVYVRPARRGEDGGCVVGLNVSSIGRREREQITSFLASV